MKIHSIVLRILIVENVQIFERLREINMLTNCRLQQHEEEEKGAVFFIIKDDIFITKDRAKFLITFYRLFLFWIVRILIIRLKNFL